MSCPAHYFDGISPVPRIGTLAVRSDQLLFSDSEGETLSTSIGTLEPVRYVGRDIILDCPAPDPATPAAYWVVERQAFEAQLKPQLVLVRSNFGRRVPLMAWVLLCVVLLPIAFIVTMRLTELGHLLVPVAKEQAMGEAFFESLAHTASPCTNAAISNVLNQMVQELRDPASPYHPTISLWYEDTPNAFALPGGHIIVFTGILPVAGGSDAIAGVLAHELAHVEQRHSLKQMLRGLGLMSFSSAVIGGSIEGLDDIEKAAEMSSMLALLKYSRAAEHEADMIAVEKLHSRGYSVAGTEAFFNRLDNETPSSKGFGSAISWLSTHPGTKDRQAFIISQLKTEAFKPKPWNVPSINWTNPIPIP